MITLHVFSDASEKAYGACVYALSTDKQPKTHTYLICSKSLVALPRLELWGAVLLVRLIETVHKSL